MKFIKYVTDQIFTTEDFMYSFDGIVKRRARIMNLGEEAQKSDKIVL